LGAGYLEGTLGIEDGLRARLSWVGGNSGTNKQIREWIQEGGEFEDASRRFFNHFHDPTHANPWNNAGLNDSVLLIPFSGGSALRWAQNAGTFERPNLDWSWQATRNYFFQALTSGARTERDAFFAQTFRGLGNQIHLIQDRNDAHPEDPVGIIPFTTIRWLERLENWASTHRDIALGLMSQPSVLPAVSLNNSVGSFIPVSSFWDTDQYDGTVGTLPLTTGTTVGLAEHTNANFFSDDTVNSPLARHQFAFPSTRIEDYSACADNAPPGSRADRRWYISRRACPADPQQEPIDHFLASTFLPSPEPTEIAPSTQLDDRVYEDYARQLLPRAVGYSAGLINYFFRGQLDVQRVSGGITVTNASAEAMDVYTDSVTGQVIGDISVYYDAPTDTRQRIAQFFLSSPLNPGQTTLPIAFPTPSDNRRPGQYLVVFRGKLGAEEGAVVGQVTTPIQIYYVSRQGGVDKIYRMDIDGNNKTLLYDNTDLSILLGKLAPSPDGTQLAFTLHRPSGAAELWLLNVSTGSVSLLTLGEWPSWSPDGSQIVFERELGPGDRAIFRWDMETGIEAQLTDVAGFAADGRPAWAPQTDRVAYSRHNGEAADCLSTAEPNIFLINSSGAPISPVTCRNGKEPDTVFPWNRYALDGAPAWSPTEAEIVFTRKRLDGIDQGTGEYLTFNEELFKVTVADEIVTKLTDSNGRAYAELTPAWSPDGAFIAVGSQRDGDFDIWLVDPTGGYRVNLTTENLEADSFPAFVWVP
jgi:hypothetical protein